MRKLRRLPWRIPKPHHSQPAPAPSDATARAELEAEIRREAYRESLNAQPVAFAGGRYVSPKDACTPQIRRKIRHRPILPVPVAG